MATENTNVENISEEQLNDILSLPGPDNVISSEDKNKNIFNNPVNAGDKILDEALNPKKDDKDKSGKPDEEEEEEDEEEGENSGKNKPGADPEGKKRKGRPTVVSDIVGELIKSGTFLPLDDDKKIEDYTKEDVLDFVESNLAQKEETLKKEFSTQFFESLSPQLKYLADYEYNGGKNLTPILKSLLRVEEARALDPEVEKDQETIIRKWYDVSEFGTEEEIDQEIAALKDRGELDKKAKQFKPKLDAKQQEQIKKDVARQEEVKKLQQAATENYIKSIASVLQPGELNGIKIDKKIQNMLFEGLTSPQYPAMNGSTTNLLGHLLEKHQIIAPNHALVAEILWLASDPDGYKAKLRETAVKTQGEKTFKALKNAEKDKDSGSNTVVENDDNKIPKKNGTVKRKSFFSR